ncbi:Neurofibromin 1 [Balamuthia mandrillaris]
MEGDEKLIADLVERIGNMVVIQSLNQGSRSSHEEVKQDGLRKQAEEALLELSASKINIVVGALLTATESLPKQYKLEANADESEHAAFAQAKTYMLHLLGRTMAAAWDFIKRQFKNVEGLDEKEKVQLKQKEEQILPPPLEDELAKRVLDIAWHILLRPNPASAELKATAGKILFQLSASNYENVANKIDLSSAADENTSPLCLIEYLNVNAAHLSNLLQKVTSAAKAGAYKKDHQKTLLSRVLTKAIWSWIDHYPMEFVNLCQSGSRLDGEPDELFDIFAGWSGKNKKGQFWQLQTMLLILCPDIMLQVSLKKGKPKDGGHKDKFMNDLNKALKGKLADVSVVCYVDICKASTFVSKQDMSALRYIIPSIETELKERLFNPERPFQMSGGDEVQLMTDCLIATFRLSPRKVVNSLFTDFLSKEFPPVFKLVLVNTLQRIVDEGQSLPWTPTIADAYSGIAHQLRTLFQDLVNHTSAYDELRRQNDKNAKKQIEKVGYEMSIDILRRVIVLFNSDPTLALFPKDKSDVEAIRNLLTGLCTCASFFSLPELSVAASEALVALHKPENIARWCSSDVINGFWDISSAVNISIATVLAEREDLEINDSRQLIGVLKQILELRNEFLAKHKDAQPTSGEHSNTKAQSSKSLEVALLIHLCSSETEIVSKVETCFGLLCDEVDILGETDSENTIVANYVTYRKLASTSVMFTGRAAQQRAIRVELRRIRATPGNLQAWQLVEKRWSRLTHLILKAEEQRLAEQANAVKKTAKTVKAGKALKVPKQSTAPALSIPNDIIVEWNHYSGFLCAAAGVCTTKSTLPVEQSRKVSTESKVKHLEKFISQLLELIVSPSDVVRETSTELTGSTLSPAAYSDLFYQLHARVQQFFGGAGQVNFGEDANKFVDQAISIIKHILELPQDTHTADDLALITDFEPLMENLIKYVSQLVSKDNPTLPLRIKGKLCACLEAMMGKIQCIPFNNEFAFRQNVVEIIMEWISDFSAKPKSYSKQPILVDLSPEKKKEFEKAAQDVDIAAIKAIASLLRGLTLSKDEREEAETSTLGKYFTFFTRLLTRAKSEQSGSPQQVKADISVVALSNLLSTNIDSALDYFTTMGYHEDLETRAAFLKVLTNILNQGTQFELPEEGERYDKLVELLLDKKLDVVLALCNAIQITEADEAAKILVRFFEANEKTMLLLKKTIEQEVKRTETENTLFRRNSMATKVLAAYTKLIGTRYLKATLSPVIHNLVSNPLNLELDPQKLPEGQKREQNIENVTVVATDFLNAIIHAIGGFIYLRFLCPAIVAPDGYGLIQSSVLTPELRRGLVLTTKVLQNLANKVMFTKEPYMEEMNAFLKQHMDTISEIFDRFATIPDKSKVPPYPVIHVSEEQREEDLANLHIHLSANLEKIKKYLSGPEHKKRGQTTILRLTTLLSQLGPPPEPTKKVFTAGPARSLPSGMKGVNARHAQFMSDHAKLDTKAIEERKLFYKHGFTNDKQPVFYYIARRFDATEVGQYPLLYHIMKTMQPELDKKYVIVIDCTLFDVEHEVPFAWINKFRQVAPSFQGLTNVYFINANHTFKKYSKRIANIL